MARVTPTVDGVLDKNQYVPGEKMTLTLTNNISAKHTFILTDPNTRWIKVSQETYKAVYTATAPDVMGVVAITIKRTWDGATGRTTVTYPVVLPAPDIFLGGSLAGNSGGRPRVPGMRVYLGAGARPVNIAGAVAEAINRSTEFVWLSAKEIDNTWLSAYLPHFATACRNAGLTPVFTSNHEPDNGTDKVDPTRYHQGWDRAVPICRGNDIVTSTILTSSNGDFQKNGPAIWDVYYRPDVDICGFDRYNRGFGTSTEKWNEPAELVSRIVAYAKSKGKPIAIGETGCGSKFPQRVEWARAMRKVILDSNNTFRYACWFDARLTLLDQATANAWFDGS